MVAQSSEPYGEGPPVSATWQYVRAAPWIRGHRPPIDYAAVEWDVVNWSKAVQFWAMNSHGMMENADILEVGARDGGLTRWLVDQGAARVLVTDVDGPSALAREAHADHLRTGMVAHSAKDVTRLGIDSAFDVVVAKSVLGALGNDGLRAQHEAIESIYKALRPGGLFLWAENMRATKVHRLARSRFTAWGSRWCYFRVGEMQEILRPFQDVCWSSAGFMGAFGRSERQRMLLGRLDTSLFDWWIPIRWSYLAFGVAWKRANACGPDAPAGSCGAGS